MARSNPAGEYVAPNPATYATGALIYGDEASNLDLVRLVEAVNKVHAHPGPPPIRQSWCQSEIVVSGATAQYFAWRIPAWTQAHTNMGLRCSVRVAANTATTPVVQFRSSSGGDTDSVTINTTAGWYDSTSAYLDCDFSGGYEDVEFWAGTAAGSFVIQAVQCTWFPLPDPLPSGANGNATPLDTAEVDPDSVLSADLADIIVDTLTALETRQSVKLCWSADFKAGSTMLPYRRIFFVPVHRGTTAQQLEHTYHVYGGDAGADTTFRLQYGPGSLSPGNHYTLRVDQPTGAPAYRDGTFVQPEAYEIADIPHPFARLELWPTPAVITPGGVYLDVAADPLTQALSVWGR